MVECLGQFRTATDTKVHAPANLLGGMRLLEVRLRNEMPVLEERLQGHDDLVAHVVEALECLQGAIQELEHGRVPAAGLPRR